MLSVIGPQVSAFGAIPDQPIPLLLGMGESLVLVVATVVLATALLRCLSGLPGRPAQPGKGSRRGLRLAHEGA